MKINSTITLKDLKGKTLPYDGHDLTLGEAIATILVTSKVAGKFKSYVLATRIADEKAPEIDDADMELIKKAVDDTETFSVLVAGQILSILDQIKK